MSISRSHLVLAVILGLAGPAAWANMADPAAAGEAQTMYIGKIEVKGQENILHTLQQIKLALNRPFSTSAADAQTIVCRIEKVVGETEQYLDCATNQAYIQRRDETRAAITSSFGETMHCYGRCSEQIALQHLLAVQPERRIHVRVDGPAFHKLIQTISLPAGTSVTAPAEASQPAGN